MLAAFYGKNKTRWIVAASVVPVLLFFYTFFQFVTNIPFQDDYDALLEPVTRFTNLHSFSWDEFVKIVWTQDDERRIVVDRVVAILSYVLAGQLDLRLHAFLGLLSLFGFLYLFYTIIRDARLPLVWVLICVLLLFHIQYYETIFWAMIPLQHLIVYFFSLLAFYLLWSTEPYRFPLALLVAILAILSDVSGTFILPAGLLLLAIQHRWRYAIGWGLVVGGMVLLYYYHFTVPSFRPKFSDNLQHPGYMIGRVLVASGLSFDFNSVLPGSLRLGLIMLVGAVLWLLVLFWAIPLALSALGKKGTRLTRWESVLWGGIFHISITLLALAIGRAVEGIDPLLISRYKHIGFIWLILILLLVNSKLTPAIQVLSSKIWLGVAVLIGIFSYFQYLGSLDYFYKERNTDMYDWTYNRSIPSSPIYISVRAGVDSMTVQAIRAGVYQLPSHYFFDKPYQAQKTIFPLLVEKIGEDGLLFSNDTYTKPFGKHEGAFVVLSSATQHHILPTQQKRYSLKSFLGSLGRHYFANGFATTFARPYLLNNQTYTVQVLVIENNEKKIYPTGYTINVVNNSAQLISQIPGNR